MILILSVLVILEINRHHEIWTHGNREILHLPGYEPGSYVLQIQHPTNQAKGLQWNH